jgi:hypothetical protein
MYLLGVIGVDKFIKASTFLRSMTLFSLDIMKPRTFLENTMIAYLYGFKIIPNSLHLRKDLMSF